MYSVVVSHHNAYDIDDIFEDFLIISSILHKLHLVVFFVFVSGPNQAIFLDIFESSLVCPLVESNT